MKGPFVKDIKNQIITGGGSGPVVSPLEYPRLNPAFYIVTVRKDKN